MPDEPAKATMPLTDESGATGMQVLVVTAAACVVLVLLSAARPGLAGPAQWLTDWTTWVAEVVALVVAARVLWVGADALARYVPGARGRADS